MEAAVITTKTAGDKQVSITFTGEVGVDYYVIYRAGIAVWSDLDEDYKTSGGGTVVILSLTNKTQYEFQVVGYDGADYSFPSNAVFGLPTDSTELPPPLRTSLRQKCVYWPPSADRWDDFGQPQTSSPTVINCRWEDIKEEIITASGTRILSRATVMLETDVEESGILMLGVLADITDDDPKSNSGAWEILKFDKLPNLRATQMLRRAYL